MSFAIPSDLKNIVLYWWKIIDRPIINIDELYNFIAFDLYLASLEKTKEIVNEAIENKFLIFDERHETIQLSSELNEIFETWQAQGYEKAKQMKKILSNEWREHLPISEKMINEVLQLDIIDIAVREKAGKLLASAIKIDKMDFNEEISGFASDNGIEENNEDQKYLFKIFPKRQEIIHNCPEYLNLRKNQKRLCYHLARVLTKLYISDMERTGIMVRDIVENHEKWKFL